MDQTESSIFTKKNIIAALVVLILILIIPVAVILVGKSQILRSRASSNAITVLPGPNIITTTPGAFTTTSTTLNLQLNANNPAQPTPAH